MASKVKRPKAPKLVVFRTKTGALVRFRATGKHKHKKKGRCPYCGR